MNLLSLRLCVHDSNITYFDGDGIHYIKSERIKNIKHHAFDNLWEWKKIIYDLWNLKENEIDDLSIILDPWRYGLEFDKKNFFPTKKCEILNATHINHHYAHALSNDLYFNDLNNHVVIDGFGDWSDAASIIKNHQLINFIDKDKNGSIGLEYSLAGSNIFKLSAHPNDFAGKVMCLQAYGNFDVDLYNELKNLSIKDVHVICDFSNYIKFKGSEKLAELTRLDWWKTIHKKLGEVILEYILNFYNKNETIGYSGGVCHNIIWNTFLKNHIPNLKIAAHCDDEGLSLGGLKYLLNKYKINKYKLNYYQFDEKPKTKLKENTLKKNSRTFKRREYNCFI
jgi:predicted NodU family carbamoyl transferase